MKTTRCIVPITVITTVFLLLSCRSETPEIFPESTTFNSNKVKHIHLSEGVSFELSPPMRISRFRIHDTLFIASGRSTINDYGLHIYNLNSGYLISSFAKRGRGPDEIQGVIDFQLLSGCRELFFSDQGFRRTWIYSLDSILSGANQPVIETISYRDSIFIVELKLDDGEYLSKYTSSKLDVGSEMLIKHSLPSYQITGGIDFPRANERFHKIGTRNLEGILGKDLSYNPDNGMIVAAYYNFDLLEVYDVSLERKLRIHGPDRFLPEFYFVAPMTMGSPGLTAQAAGGSQLPRTVLDNVVYPAGIFRWGFRYSFAGRDGFYVSYNGKFKPLDSNERVLPEKLFYFGYDGSPLKKYTFDRGGFLQFQVIEKEGIIYLVDKMGDIYIYSLK